MKPLRTLSLENLEARDLLAVDVLAEIPVADDPRFLPRDLTSFKGNIYLRLSDGFSGPEPWITDGTPGSTRILKDINVGNFGSGARDFVEYNDRLFFTANNGFSGLELWVTDGTKATTQPIADIWPGSENAAPTELTPFNGLLYFFANDGTTGRELYSSDGTAIGTGPLADSVEGLNGSSGEDLMVIGDQMFFRSESTRIEVNGIWVSDGSGAGTRHVPIDGVDTNDIQHMVAFGERLAFTSGSKIWVTDGTVEGSQVLAPIGELGENFTSLAAVGERLYVTDELGLHEISDSLTSSRVVSSLASEVAVRDGKAYYWNANGLFVISDGTPSSLIRFNPLFGSEMGTTAEVPGGMIFNFKRALDRHEIWVTDGTTAGTKLLENVTDNSAEPLNQFNQIGDLIYFSATNGNFHESIWTIPAPTINVVEPDIPGDVNNDNLVDARDIDAVHAAIAANLTDDKYDFNEDSKVDHADVEHLLVNILQTRRGDLDLNGKVDFADFLKLSGAFGSSNASWADGDIDGDGSVAFADFLALSTHFGFDDEV